MGNFFLFAAVLMLLYVCYHAVFIFPRMHIFEKAPSYPGYYLQIRKLEKYHFCFSLSLFPGVPNYLMQGIICEITI